MSYVVFYVIYTKIQGTYILIEKNCFDKKVVLLLNNTFLDIFIVTLIS